MTWDIERGPLFRPIVPHQHSRVTYAELLFDLVFVFAVTQVSHTLLPHFTPLGAVQTTLLLLSVWWVWVYTSWITNWLNPELTPVRILLFLLMLGGLVLSTSIPLAFEFTRPVVCDRLCRDAGRPHHFLAGIDAASAHGSPDERHSHPGLAVDFGRLLDRRRTGAGAGEAPALGAGLGNRICVARGAVLDSEIRRIDRSRTGTSKAAILAERCAGFIIIALGESIVVTGATLRRFEMDL